MPSIEILILSPQKYTAQKQHLWQQMNWYLFKCFVTDLAVQFRLCNCRWMQELHALEERHTETAQNLPVLTDSIRLS